MFVERDGQACMFVGPTLRVNYPHLKEGASGSPAEDSCFSEAACAKVFLSVEAVSPQA